MPSEFGFETTEDREKAKKNKLVEFEALFAALKTVADEKDNLFRAVLSDFIFAHPERFKEFSSGLPWAKKEFKKEAVKIERFEGSLTYEAGLSIFAYAAQFDNFFQLEVPHVKGRIPCYSWGTRRANPSLGVVLFFAPEKELMLGLYPPLRPAAFQFTKEDKFFETELDKLAEVLQNQTGFKCLRAKKSIA
jgi:hypothetical protein